MSKRFGSSCVAIHQNVEAEFPKLRKWLAFRVFLCQDLFWLDVKEDLQSPDLAIYLKTKIIIPFHFHIPTFFYNNCEPVLGRTS